MSKYKIIKYSDNTFIIKERILLCFYYTWTLKFNTLKDAKQSIDELIERRKEKEKILKIKTYKYNGPSR